MTPKQRAFAREYLIDHNGTQAAIRAGYSAHTANEQASALLAKPNIRALVDAGTKKKAQKLELTAERVLADIIRLTKKAEDAGEINNAFKGVELQGKHLKLFTDKVEHSGSVTIKVINPYAKEDE